MEKRERIAELVELLNKAAYAYEQEDREIMSNYEYDALYDELQKLEEETGFVMAQSPTIRTGYEVLSELPKERHVAPMLSLDKTKDVEALKTFLGEKEGLLSWKMDGLTNVLTYRNGELVKAVLDHEEKNTSRYAIITEAVQTAASAIRFLKNFEEKNNG